MSWTTSEIDSLILLPDNGCWVNVISAVKIDEERIVTACQQNDYRNRTVILKINELEGNVNKYASLQASPSYNMFSNVEVIHNKIYVTNIRYTSIELEHFCLCIFAITICNRRNEWSCIHKRNFRNGGPALQDNKIVVADNYLYIFENNNNNNFGRYNIIQNVWETLPPIPIPTQEPIRSYTVFRDAVRCGNYIFLLGIMSRVDYQILIEVFDIIIQQWKIMNKPPPMPLRRRNHATVAVNDRYIVVIGGYNEEDIIASDSQILDTFTNIWYISECNMSTERHSCGVTVSNGHDPQLTVIGGWNRNKEDLCSVETISLYRLQPKLLPHWQKELHQYYCTQVKKRVMLMLQAVRRGDFPIPKDILMDHIFPYACSPLD